MFKVSCGVIIADDDSILLGHATGKSKKYGYDIFKGWAWFNIENHKSAALRELKEESGIVLKRKDLQDLGIFKYQKNKDLHLYIYRSKSIKKEFPINTLHCKSTFPVSITPSYNVLSWRGMSNLVQTLPEMDGFKICKINNMEQFMYRGLFKIISKILK